MLDAGCSMLDAGCWMLDTRCWMLNAGGVDQGGGVEGQDVSLDQRHIVQVRQHALQHRHQPLVQLDGDHVPGFRGQPPGQRPQSRAHLQDDIVGGQFSGSDYSIERGPICEKILAQPFAWLEVPLL
jgi:hypothetical protein